MYESPITKIFTDISNQIMKQEEDRTMLTINQTVGYSVDKDELIKALNYDRQQYEKGYEDGKKDACRWILISERLPEEHETVIGLDCSDSVCKTERYDDCGEIKWYADGCFDTPIVAWMPLPEQYRESEVSE